MFKQKLILAVLLLAFGLVLTHSIVPHHHHKSNVEAINHKDDPIEQSLEHYLHSNDGGDCFLASGNNFVFSPAIDNEISVFNFQLKIEKCTDLCLGTQTDDFIPLFKPLSGIGFRGPPQA